MGPTPYMEMWVACLRALTAPSLPARCRFFHDMGGQPSLTCIVAGPEREGGPEMVGMSLITGRFYGPQAIIPEARAEVLSYFD